MSDLDFTPTEITAKDIDNFLEKLMNGDYCMKPRPCFTCSKNFIPSYNDMDCDERWFSRFPKD